MLLYRTLLCKKIARAPGGHKRFMPTKLRGIDPIALTIRETLDFFLGGGGGVLYRAGGG